MLAAIAALYWPALTHSTKHSKCLRVSKIRKKQNNHKSLCASTTWHWLRIMFVHYFHQIRPSPSWKASWAHFSLPFSNNFLHVFWRSRLMFCSALCALWGENWPNKLSDLLLTFPRALNGARAWIMKCQDRLHERERDQSGRPNPSGVVVNWSSSAATATTISHNSHWPRALWLTLVKAGHRESCASLVSWSSGSQLWSSVVRADNRF